MEVIILAAGYGTRLYPLTEHTPKPLLEIGGKPIANYIVDNLLQRSPAPHISVVTNAPHYDHFKQWQKRFYADINLTVVNDGTTSNETRLGAIRDIEYCLEHQQTNDDLLVVAGDNYVDMNLYKLVDFGRNKGNSILVSDIKSLEKARHFGTVHINAETQQVTSFEEKTPEPISSLVSTCIYYFPSATIPLIRSYIESGQEVDPPGRFIKWLGQQFGVYACVMTEQWFDIGSIEAYRQADEFLSQQQNRI